MNMHRILGVLLATVILATAGSASAVGELRDCRLKKFDTQAHLEASNSEDCTLAYALDTDLFELRANGSWTTIGTLVSLVGAQGGTFSNSVDTVWKLVEGATSEDLKFTATADLWTIDSGTSATIVITPATTVSGDLTLSGAAGALTFNSASSSIVTTDNSATGLVLGSSGTLAALTLDTRDGVEGLIDAGYLTVGTTLGVTGVLTPAAGAGALTFSNTAASILVNDNDSTALDIGSTGTTAGLRYSSLDNREALTFSSAGQINTESAVDTVSRTLDETDCGKDMLFSAAFDGQVFTLPSTINGCIYTFTYTGAAAGALLTITPQGGDGIYGQAHGLMTIAASANAACSTTCAANLCRFGMNTGGLFVACSDATADSCICDEAALSGTDAASVKITKATIKKGDMVRMIGDGVDGWYVIGGQGALTN
jgi:hypothetical protein